MATDSENLQTTLSNFIAAKAALSAQAAAGTLKPSYSINGQSVDWVRYYEWLDSQIDSLRRQISDNEGPFEVVTQGFV